MPNLPVNMDNARQSFINHWPMALLVLVVVFVLWHYNMQGKS